MTKRPTAEIIADLEQIADWSQAQGLVPAPPRKLLREAATALAEAEEQAKTWTAKATVAASAGMALGNEGVAWMKRAEAAEAKLAEAEAQIKHDHEHIVKWWALSIKAVADAAIVAHKDFDFAYVEQWIIKGLTEPKQRAEAERDALRKWLANADNRWPHEDEDGYEPGMVCTQCVLDELAALLQQEAEG